MGECPLPHARENVARSLRWVGDRSLNPSPTRLKRPPFSPWQLSVRSILLSPLPSITLKPDCVLLPPAPRTSARPPCCPYSILCVALCLLTLNPPLPCPAATTVSCALSITLLYSANTRLPILPKFLFLSLSPDPLTPSSFTSAIIFLLCIFVPDAWTAFNLSFSPAWRDISTSAAPLLFLPHRVSLPSSITRRAPPPA